MIQSYIDCNVKMLLLNFKHPSPGSENFHVIKKKIPLNNKCSDCTIDHPKREIRHGLNANNWKKLPPWDVQGSLVLAQCSVWQDINRKADYSVWASVPLLNRRYCVFVAHTAPGPWWEFFKMLLWGIICVQMHFNQVILRGELPQCFEGVKWRLWTVLGNSGFFIILLLRHCVVLEKWIIEFDRKDDTMDIYY